MLLGRDRVFLGLLDDLQLGHVELEATGDSGCALVRPHVAGNDQGGFERQALGRLEDLLGNIALENHRLDEARPVADAQKLQLALAGL